MKGIQGTAIPSAGESGGWIVNESVREGVRRNGCKGRGEREGVRVNEKEGGGRKGRGGREGVGGPGRRDGVRSKGCTSLPPTLISRPTAALSFSTPPFHSFPNSSPSLNSFPLPAPLSYSSPLPAALFPRRFRQWQRLRQQVQEWEVSACLQSPSSLSGTLPALIQLCMSAYYVTSASTHAAVSVAEQRVMANASGAAGGAAGGAAAAGASGGAASTREEVGPAC
ncbi:unnamed protein product [Closterium sp. NIES-65]|nr:unnamed protein product [Closterium sp. NIES-65]